MLSIDDRPTWTPPAAPAERLAGSCCGGDWSGDARRRETAMSDRRYNTDPWMQIGEARDQVKVLNETFKDAGMVLKWQVGHHLVLTKFWNYGPERTCSKCNTKTRNITVAEEDRLKWVVCTECAQRLLGVTLENPLLEMLKDMKRRPEGWPETA